MTTAVIAIIVLVLANDFNKDKLFKSACKNTAFADTRKPVAIYEISNLNRNTEPRFVASNDLSTW